VPCDELGGDLYDYDAWGPEGVAFVLADVSGHGASAAMLTGVVKSAFRSCAGERYEPLAVVQRIHAGLRSFGDHRFVTLICGRLAGGSPFLEWVNAGHPGGLFRRAGGAVATLEATGPLVSPALEGLAWRQERTELGSAGQLLLYTDGVSEAPGTDGFFGVERLRQAAEGRPDGEGDPADAVLRAVAEHMAGRPPEDDLTLLAVSWGPAV
jgi:sigma-B regulation protein RsbU (phosphoserine phosphatase)